jgi:hypothetical protein
VLARAGSILGGAGKRLNLHPDARGGGWQAMLAGTAGSHVSKFFHPEDRALTLQSKDVFATGTPAWHDHRAGQKSDGDRGGAKDGRTLRSWRKLTRARTGWLLVLTRSGQKPG